MIGFMIGADAHKWCSATLPVTFEINESASCKSLIIEIIMRRQAMRGRWQNLEISERDSMELIIMVIELGGPADVS